LHLCKKKDGKSDEIIITVSLIINKSFIEHYI